MSMHDPVLTAVYMHYAKLIEVLRRAVRAHPGHAASDAFAQTFLVQNLRRVSISCAFDSEDET